LTIQLNNFSKRILIIAVLTLAATGVINHVVNISPLKNEDLFKFPQKIGKWHGKNIPMENRIFESLETPYAILRNYHSAKGEKINLAIVWYDDKEIAFHSAASCLGSSGDKVKEDGPYEINLADNKSINIARLITNKFNVTNLVLYYYVNDGFITGSQVTLRWNVIKQKLYFKRTSAAFVRMMMKINKNRENTMKILEDFLKISLPIVVEYTHTDNLF